MITYDEFKKVEIRAGKILSAEKIPDTDKLLKLLVDFGETKDLIPSMLHPDSGIDGKVQEIPIPEVTIAPTKIPAPRQIVSGISTHFPDPSILVGKTCMFVTNLEPRKIKGHESNGMLFAVSTPEGGFSLLEPNGTIPVGTRAA